MSTFAGPDLTATSVSGVSLVVQPGLIFTVHTALNGPQVTGLTDLAGAPLVEVKSDSLGRVSFMDPEDRMVLWLRDGGAPGSDPLWTPVLALEAAERVASAGADAAQALELATTAQQDAADARALAAGVEAVAVTVTAFGAVGDGVVDDTPAINDAIASLPSSGGRVIFPRGQTFKVDGEIRLRSGVVVEAYGATFQKRAGVPYAVFVSSSGGVAGKYGARDITIRGGTIRGNFVDGQTCGASITLHRAQNVLIEGVRWQEAHVSGHPLDLGGCDGVTVRGCVFEGWKPVVGREYSEAIGVDWSIYLGNQVDPASPGFYDGTPSTNILVEGCRFVPLGYQVNGQNYPSSPPFGSHSRVEGRWLENLTMRDCYVVGGADTTTATGFAANSRGWLHFMFARGVKIEGNTFVNTSGRACRVIGSYTYDTGVTADRTALADPGSQPITPLPATDWQIVGNRFIGFNASAAEPLIFFQGLAGAPCRKISVRDNQLEDAHPGAYNSSGSAVGTTFVDGSQLAQVVISGNQARSIRSLVYLRSAVDVTVHANQVDTSWWAEVFRFDDCDGVSVRGQQLRDVLGFLYTLRTVRLTVADNDVNIPASPVVGRSSVVACSGAAAFKIRDNIFRCQQALNRGIYVYSTPSLGQVNNNIQTGTYTTKVDATGTSITATGNI